jgi:hypothetical protein
MKKLIFVGCSFTAGDGVAWDFYNPTVPWATARDTWRDDPELGKKMYDYYTNLRNLHTLSTQCANNLRCNSIDLSEDGNSNTNIAHSVIHYISSLDEEDRKDLHVCAGWTTIERVLKFIPSQNLFANFNHVLLERPDSYMKPIIDELYTYLKEVMINGHDMDHWLSYMSSVMLLENFLKANNITYTFWRSMGGWDSETEKYQNYQETASKHKKFATLNNTLNYDLWNMSNKENWIDFIPLNNTRVFDPAPPWWGDGQSWSMTFTEDDIIPNDRHPNLNCVKRFATLISEKIKSQNEI